MTEQIIATETQTIELQPTPEQLEAWTREAGEAGGADVADWLKGLADRASRVSKMSEPVTVKLRKPITFGGRTLAQLTFRPPKAKDLRKIKDTASAIDVTLSMAGWLSGELNEMIDQLEGADISRVRDVIQGFLSDIP